MNIRMTLLLVALFVLTLSFVVYLDQSHEDSKASKKQLIDCNIKNVKKIIIRQHKKKQTIVFQKNKEEWIMSKPEHSQVNQKAVDSLLSCFELGYIDSFEITDSNISEYGLSDPTVALSLIPQKNRNNSCSFVIRIGDETPDGTMCYCQTNKISKIYTVGLLYKERMLRSPSYYL